MHLNMLSSENITQDHCSAVQSLYFFAKASRFFIPAVRRDFWAALLLGISGPSKWPSSLIALKFPQAPAEKSSDWRQSSLGI
jgi:hypothetical protein